MHLENLFNEKWVGKSVLAVITLYIIIYGIRIAQGFHIDDLFSSIYLSILPFSFLIDGVKNILESSFSKQHHEGRENSKQISVIIPTYNGGETLAVVIEDLLKRFPKENIIISSNGSTDKTCDIAKKYRVKLIEIPNPIGKVRAINAALGQVKTPYVLILDDDTLVGDTKFPTSLLEEHYDAVAFMVLPKQENWLTRLQAHEYKKSMEIGKVFHNKYGTVQNISGAIGLFHTKDLIKQTETHTCEFSGEDLQRTLRIHLNKSNKGIIIQKSAVYTYVPKTITALFNQRVYGWSPGFYSNFFLYLKILFNSNCRISLRLEAFYNVFLVTLFDLFRLVALPVLVFYPGYFIVMYICYVGLETISHYRLHIREPYWVILVYPLYGLFNFIARVCAIYVFLYRRLTANIGRVQYLDDYKLAVLHVKIVSFIIAVGATANTALFYIVLKIAFTQ